MFTNKAQAIFDLAKDYAADHEKQVLDIESLLAAIGNDTEASVRLAEVLKMGDVAAVRTKCPHFGQPKPSSGKLDLDEPLREILSLCMDLASAEGVPDRDHPGLIDVRHLVCAIALSRHACRLLGEIMPMTREEVLRILTAWYAETSDGISLTDLVGDLRSLRSQLLATVFGQDHAVHAFIESLYNVEVTATADTERTRPSAVFVFAGPPGVGKTFLAERTAALLGRPFRRFDMTGYSDHQQHNQLVGFARSYQGAHPGLLTGFVDKNPNSFLLFDEIEKAHLNTVQLFHQILDAGRLEDKYFERDVSFRDTIIILTTNAGRSLYDNPNRIGISAANSTYHKKTILSALESEKNPNTGQPAFPQAIVSRVAQGYPIMFNHLGANELIRVCGVELARTETLLAKQHFKDFSHDPLLPICLVLREGGRADARQLRAEAERFVKNELFKYCSLYDQRSLEEAFEGFDRVRFEVDSNHKAIEPEVSALLESPDKPTVLLVAKSDFSKLCQDNVEQMNWLTVSTAEETSDILSTEDIDMVLLDLWLGDDGESPADSGSDRESADDMQFDGKKKIDEAYDFVPLSARALDKGRGILERIHERFPEIPVYLLSSSSYEDGSYGEQEYETIRTVSFDATQGYEDVDVGGPSLGTIDDELFLACVRSGGARGLVATDFASTTGTDRETSARRFAESLVEINRRLYREKMARSLAQERKALVFDTTASVDSESRRLLIRPRNFRLVRAIEATDAGEMVDDIQRPGTRFDDVIGAKGAKRSLEFVVDWLRNPKRYTALGVRPPKGILLSGPPGTGKTMLARAVAGESNCAFVQATATGFVTIWQGSGPQNVRNLFNRARRYAPAIVFIDEIDAIGKGRTGGAGSGRTTEETLNALLTEMDGFLAPLLQPVIVLAATNVADQLDEALKRRFDRVIEVDRPDKEGRLEYLKKAVLERKRSVVSESAVERLAGQSTGMSIADLERIIHEAAVMAAQEDSDMTDDILKEAFEKTRMGEASNRPDEETLRRIACHESGHALLGWLMNRPPVQVTIVGRGHAAGYVEMESQEERIIYTKIELENTICELMGGRAGEIVCYGSEEGLSTGISDDLRKATRWAQRMAREFGMTEDLGQVALDGHQLSDGPLAIKVTEVAGRIVSSQMQTAIKILTENREHLDRLVEALLEKNSLTREDLEDILPPLGDTPTS